MMFDIGTVFCGGTKYLIRYRRHGPSNQYSDDTALGVGRRGEVLYPHYHGERSNKAGAFRHRDQQHTVGRTLDGVQRGWRIHGGSAFAWYHRSETILSASVGG